MTQVQYLYLILQTIEIKTKESNDWTKASNDANNAFNKSANLRY